MSDLHCQKKILTIIEWGWVCCEELCRTRRMLWQLPDVFFMQILVLLISRWHPSLIKHYVLCILAFPPFTAMTKYFERIMILFIKWRMYHLCMNLSAKSKWLTIEQNIMSLLICLQLSEADISSVYLSYEQINYSMGYDEPTPTRPKSSRPKSSRPKTAGRPKTGKK